MKRLALAVLTIMLFGAGCSASTQASNNSSAAPVQKTAPPTPPEHIPLPTPVHPTSSTK